MEQRRTTYGVLSEFAGLQGPLEVVQELVGAYSLDARPYDILIVADAIDRCALLQIKS